MIGRHTSRPVVLSTRRGFSYAELVIVILIMGIMAAIAIPRIAQSMSFYRLNAAAERVASDLRYARGQARMKGTSQSVVFNAATDSYDLPGLFSIDHPSQPFSLNLPTSAYPADIQSTFFGVDGTGGTVIFDLYGRPDYPGSLILDVEGNSRTIVLNAFGKVDVQP